MKPREVKDMAAACDCVPCKQITARDYYISRPTKIGPDWREITVKYGPRPCRGGCGLEVNIGDIAMQKSGVGVRHIGC